MALHTSFECGDGTVAIAQRGINSREGEFGATQRAIPFDRPSAPMTMKISGTEIVAGDVTKPGSHRL